MLTTWTLAADKPVLIWQVSASVPWRIDKANRIPVFCHRRDINRRFRYRSRGQRWGMDCPNCKADIPVGSKSCVRCGAVLAAGSPPSLAIVPSTASAERRQLTVMFCDLVGSTALSGRVDPEGRPEVEVGYTNKLAEK